MTETPQLSGWCSPWCSPRSHGTCQDRLERGLLDRCACPKGHPGYTTQGDAARKVLHATEEDSGDA